ncbi:MAG: LCP family protein [Eubacteriales bacterium]|nr:LCP family protein [Eubacteriales bacterium]
MSGKKGKKLKRVLFGLEIVILLLFLGGLYVYGQISARMTKLETTTTPETFDDTKIVTNETAPVMTGYKTYALFGIDHRSKNASLGTDNSDTIIIASVNNDTKDVRLVSVYRDTLLNIGGGTYAKANAAYAYGGAEQAISMLNTNLDLNITDYATVDFNALTAAVDAVGGLEIPLSYAEIVHLNSYCEETSVETGKEYTPLELPEPRPEDIEAIVDIYHLNGVQSTSYCRIRYTASLDMGRTERQRRVLQMLMDKGKKAGLTTLFRIMDEVFPLVTTSLTKTEILTMIPTVIGYHMDETVGFPMNFKFSNARGSIIVADTLENNVRQLHQFLYGPDENYVPSQNILDASAKILEIAGGADNLVEEAPPVAEGENVNTDFFWQDDGSGGNAWDDGNGGYVDPNADGGQYQGEGEVVDPDTGGGETGGDTYTEPDGGDGSSGEGAGGDAYVDPGTGGDGGGDVYVDPGAGGEEFLDAGDLSLDIGE